MRLARRLNTGEKWGASTIALGFLFTLSACSLPDVTVSKNRTRAENGGAGFFTDKNVGAFSAPRPGTKTYLATVQVQFSEHSAPVTFDIRRERQDLISADMVETEHTSTYLHMGYSHEEGGIAGLRFSFRF